MPELPDLTVYLEHLEARTRGATLDGMRFASPFVLRSVSPPVEELLGRDVLGWRRLAKQLVLTLDGEYFVVIHLMIAGRLQWQEDRRKPVPKRNGLVAFDFSTGTVVFTEASKKKRASVRLVAGNEALLELDPGGLEVFEVDRDTFAHRIRETNHTLKRALTDQHVFAGIGNAYSDEILLHAKLSPFKRPASLNEAEMDRLFAACRRVLEEWVERLRAKSGDNFPKKVTAFHPEMAVHGRYGEACPVCGAPVQRIRYAENESNYCARCQTDGRVLADRSLSRLLKDNWPKRIEDLE